MQLTAKIISVMKFTAFLCLVGCLQVSAAVTGQLVTLSEKQVSLKKVFRELNRQTGFEFLYKDAYLKDTKPVDISVTGASITEVLTICFKDLPLTYEIVDKTIIIKPAVKLFDPKPVVEVPPITIRGKIINEKEEPVVASIVIKNTKRGTTSDADGFFTLDNVDDNAELIISATNIETVTVPVNNKTSLNILVKMTSSSLNEVVVNKGYYTEKKKFSTGSVSRVSAKDIERQPVTSPLMSLQGRMPGVDVTPINGVAGSAFKIVIRGRNSIVNVNATPLYIVDGVQINSTSISTDNQAVVNEGFDPLSSLNPANIENVEVLKDADATAIYGSLGANGVVLITTKRGSRSEKTNVDMNVYSGIGRIPKFLDLLNTQEYVKIRNEAFINANNPINPITARDLTVWDTTRYTDWQKELIGGSSSIIDAQTNISSGNAFTNFRFGAGYHKETTIYPGDFGFQRISGNFSLTHNSPNKKFRASVNMNYGVESNKLFSGLSLTDLATKLAPNAPALYDMNGELNWENSTFNNPLAYFRQTNNNKGNNLILNTTAAYEIVRDLNLKINLGYNHIDRNAITKSSPFSAMDPAKINDKTTATSLFEINKRQGWLIEPQITYQRNAGLLELNIVAGGNWQENTAAYQLVEASGYTSDLLLESLRGATKTTYFKDDDSHYRYMAVFGRAGLIYNERYILNLTGRRDGSSRFGPGRRWGNFGAVGAAWIFSEEKFMDGFSFLSFGKLRGSYGVTGSDQVNDYEYISSYQYGAYNYEGQITLVPFNIANRNFAWEQTTKLEAALELRFLQNRINLETVFYINRCGNQLLKYQLPGASGAGNMGVTENQDAIVENRGLEISLQTINISRANFQWQTSLNFTLPYNKLVSYPGITESLDANRLVVGQPLSIVKLYHFVGVNPSTGFYEVEDADKNGTIDYRDKTFIQNTGRVFYGGLNNMLRYKNLELSFLLQFSSQTSYNAVLFVPGNLPNNLPREVIGNYWQNDGDIRNYQKATTNISDGAGLANESDAVYISNSFVRLKTVSLSYNLSSALLTKAGLGSLKIFLQGQNLATFSNFKALDPEAGAYSLPPLQIITAGLEIKL